MPKAFNKFAHPAEHEFEYDELLEAMRACRHVVHRFSTACGLRNPARREADALIEQIDAVARLSRVSGASEYVTPSNLGHATPAPRR